MERLSNNINLNVDELISLRTALADEIQELRQKAKMTVKDWLIKISGFTNIDIYGYLDGRYSCLNNLGTSEAIFSEAVIYFVDDAGNRVFGSDLTLSWYGDYITAKASTTGTFTVLGQTNEPYEYSKYQCYKYILLGKIIEHAEELNDALNSLDYSAFSFFISVQSRINEENERARQEKERAEIKEILDSLTIDTEYFDTIHGVHLKIIKICNVRMEVAVFENGVLKVQRSYRSKKEFVDNIRARKYVLVN